MLQPMQQCPEMVGCWPVAYLGDILLDLVEDCLEVLNPRQIRRTEHIYRRSCLVYKPCKFIGPLHFVFLPPHESDIVAKYYVGILVAVSTFNGGQFTQIDRFLGDTD